MMFNPIKVPPDECHHFNNLLFLSSIKSDAFISTLNGGIWRHRSIKSPKTFGFDIRLRFPYIQPRKGGSMSLHIGFDNEKYLSEQTSAILERVHRFDNKLYLEFGGKLLFDYHAARVLPGFDPNVKMRLLQKLRDNSEVVL
jgi:hypothetical protein